MQVKKGREGELEFGIYAFLVLKIIIYAYILYLFIYEYNF